MIGSFTAQHQTSARYINVIAIAKTPTAGTTNISNNVIGSLATANSIYSYNTVAAAASQSVYGISCSGTSACTVSNNTIANITNSTTAGNLFAINISGTGSTGTVNGNLIHSNVITGATTALNYGIWCALGTNTVSNNIVRLGDNSSSEIRGMGDSGTGNINMYHNTIYVGGAPTTLALNSACLFSLGTTNIRNYKNNILVNARSNNGATGGTHYALNMTENSGGTITVDGNDYVSSGASGAVLGIYGVTAASTLLELQTATGQDAASVSVDPVFANASGTSAVDFKPTIAMLGVSGTAVGFDYDGTARLNWTMGAFEIAPVLTTSVSTLSGLNYIVGAGPSDNTHSFDVSGGTSLSGDITVTAPTNFEVSKTGLTGEYSATVTVAPTSGSVAATPIYVRLAAGLSAETYTGNVTVSAAGAVSKTVACTAIVDVATGLKTMDAGVSVFASFGAIKVIGATTGDAIEVYNSVGQKVKTLIATQSNMSISLFAKGIYVIKVGSSAKKVVLQ
jgi:hypothetical protein